MKKPRPRASMAKPDGIPSNPHAKDAPLEPNVQGNWIWCPLKAEWRVRLPEEHVRQKFILLLHTRYKFAFEQMDQERRTKHGHKSPKADVAVWESVADKKDGKAPVIVVECKSDNVTIDPDDYEQGDSYARAIGDPCEFLVMHNTKETRIFRIVRGLPGTREDIENIPAADELGDAKKMAAIRKATKTFSREEFRRLLFDCHCILRDNHKMEPGKAFDEISKILFIKMYIERTGNLDKFTIGYLDEYARIRRRNLEEVMHDLFDDTKAHYETDELFGKDDRLAISFATFRRIVQLLERFNLGATSDDVKGIAFERFLGQTFRGDLGQFFTPRPIVDFMVEVLDPSEEQVMCDPASGSGGFLIKYFEHIRRKIETDVHSAKQKARAQLEAKHLGDAAEAAAVSKAFARLNDALDVTKKGSRLWRIAHEAIFGTDAEPRAARTSKMNMIMHGDGHGGIHHHDGLVDFNGVFPCRFDVILTNPPFGATVQDDQVVGATPETRVSTSPESTKLYEKTYGKAYKASHERMVRAEQNKETILSLFDISKEAKTEKTEVLFLERCLKLLRPGGRIGIVVPDGVLNNPSQVGLREYIEDRAEVLAVVSIPDKTFRSAKTNVKASLLFLRRLSQPEMIARDRVRTKAETKARRGTKRLASTLEGMISVNWQQYSAKKAMPVARIGNKAIAAAVRFYGPALDESAFGAARKSARDRLRALKAQPALAGRTAVKKAFDYPIFMAVTEHVGIRASGREDPQNDLSAVLESWGRFISNPRAVPQDVRSPMFSIPWSSIDRWDPLSFKPIDWQCDTKLLKPLGSVLRERTEQVDREAFDFSELTPITIHFDGSIDPRDTSDADDYTMALFFARAGDIVVSKIDLKNGAVGIVPPEMSNVVVTNHFVVYEPDTSQLHPPYLLRLIQSGFFKDYLWRKKVGSEGRKEVKIDLFESTLIPIPDVPVQQAMVKTWCELDDDRKAIVAKMDKEKPILDAKLICGALPPEPASVAPPRDPS